MVSSEVSHGKSIRHVGKNVHVTKSHHADSLPNTQTNTGRNTTVQTLEAVGIVDILESLADGQVLGTVRVLSLALHLNPNNLNRLVPSRQTTTETRGKHLLPSRQLLALLLAGDLADGRLGQTGQTEAGTPVGSLANGDGVDTTVDTADTLLAIDVHERGKGAGGLDAGRGHFVLGNLDGLHAGAETHGGVGLGDTTSHTTGNTTDEVVRTQGAGLVFGFGGDEEEHGALGGGLNPGPRNESLIVWRKENKG